MNTCVTTKQGPIQGGLSQDGNTVIFKGVPYAQPPVGELRFRRPQEHEPWTEPLDCTAFSARCPQAELASMEFYGKEFYDIMIPPWNEDCLYLNIWTPAGADADSKLPVLFWIHGGAFMHGCGTEKEFDGEGYAKKGVVLVTINYRVNAFGFFAHPDLEKENPQGVSGNYGILDQIFALKWVRENIGAFGGDPEKITLSGQSAGCMSVQAIISSPLSKGMMRGAILQSGGGIQALHETPDKEQLWETSRKLMTYLGVSTVEELRRVPAEKLRDGAYAVQGPSLSWSPHVDGWLPDTTDRLAERGEIHDIAYMIGSTGDDIGGQALLQEAGTRWCENQLKLGCGTSLRPWTGAGVPGKTVTGNWPRRCPATGQTSSRPAIPTARTCPAGNPTRKTRNIPSCWRKPSTCWDNYPIKNAPESALRAFRGVSISFYSSMAKVPATIKASPMPDRLDNFSRNTKKEKATVTSMLSLSMGTTTLTTPC